MPPDRLPKLGNTGGGGIPASTAGSGTARFSGGMKGGAFDVPNKGGLLVVLGIAGDEAA